MIITREIDYALRILRELKDGGLHTIGEISAEGSVPEAFAYKILRKLDKAGLVAVVRGAAGGCRLARDLRACSMYDLITALGGCTALSACLEPGFRCEWRDSHGACTVHENLRGLQAQLDDALRQHSLWDILGPG